MIASFLPSSMHCSNDALSNSPHNPRTCKSRSNLFLYINNFESVVPRKILKLFFIPSSLLERHSLIFQSLQKHLLGPFNNFGFACQSVMVSVDFLTNTSHGPTSSTWNTKDWVPATCRECKCGPTNRSSVIIVVSLMCGCAPPYDFDICWALSACLHWLSMPRTVIKPEHPVIVWILYLQTINDIFKLKTHAIWVPVAFVVYSNKQVFYKWIFRQDVLVDRSQNLHRCVLICVSCCACSPLQISLRI